MLKRIIIIAVVILFVYACQDELFNSSETESDGRLLLKIESTNIPDNVKQIRAILSRRGYSSIVKTEDVNQQVVSEIVFNSVVTGVWKIQVDALDSEGEVIYTGSAEVEVTERQTAVVGLTLHPVGSGTGSILLIINWPAQHRFIDNPGNPVLSRTGNTFDRYGIYESSVYSDENGWQMWFTGYQGNDVSYIFHAHSDDGFSWQRINNLPVMYPGDLGEWDEQSVTAGPVIKKQGMYMMYYHGRRSRAGTWHTGLATSQDGLVWEKYNNPVLYGEEYKWDYRVSASHLEVIGNKYYMYYTGISIEGLYNIGLAMSDDGLSWTKYAGNPILTANQEWEGIGVYWPTVYKTGDTYKMIYQNKNGNVSGFGQAISYDGLTWAKNYNEPVFTNLDTYNNWDLILYPHTVVNDNKLILYYSGYIATINEKFICFAAKNID